MARPSPLARSPIFSFALSFAALLVVFVGAFSTAGRTQSSHQPAARSDALGAHQPNFDRLARQQAETDQAWRAASDGFMRMQKITFRSRVGDLDIPAFVFEPLADNGRRAHPALVWVHEDVRGH